MEKAYKNLITKHKEELEILLGLNLTEDQLKEKIPFIELEFGLKYGAVRALEKTSNEVLH
jgi:hypothetical protein